MEIGKSLFRIVLAVYLVLSTLGDGSFAAQPVVLLTEAEGGMADTPTGLIDAGNILNTGPEIEVIKPDQADSLRSPTPIVVRFIPNGKDVKISSLKVEVLKFVTIDITERVLPYATKEGIQVENAVLPPGEHKIRVTIGDVDGGISQKIIVVKIL